jgi:hypothetical protein
MFFQQPADEPAESPRPELPDWVGPPRAGRGAVVATELLLARSANVAIVLPYVLVYRTGCLFNVEVVIRKARLSDDDWWDLTRSAIDAARLPHRQWDRVLRVGLRYPDGSTVTNVDPRPDTSENTAPVGPLLSWTPVGGGGSIAHQSSQFGMWLWPLPPAQPLQVAAEWPLGGIELTITELDGAELAAAATRSTNYWSD